MAASHLYLSTETNQSTGTKLRTTLCIYTRVERALRARIGPWPLVGPSRGLSLGAGGSLRGPWALVGAPWALVGPCGYRALPWALPWALWGPCGDRALSGSQHIRKTKHVQRLETFTISK